MTQAILLWCVAAPVLIALATVTACLVLQRGGSQRSWFPIVAAMLAVGGWNIAITVALIARQSPSWWPTDAWQQVLYPIFFTSVCLACLVRDHPVGRDARWLVAGLGAAATGMLAMPGGEGWADLHSLHRYWMFAVVASSLLNLWMLDSLARRGAQGWVLWVNVTGLGASAILAATAYGGLAEWLLAGISATIVMAIASGFARSAFLWCAIYAASLFAAAATAAGRFYTYEDHPVWLYATILLVPSIVVAIDLPVRKRSTAIRVGVAGAVSAILLAIVAWKISG